MEIINNPKERPRIELSTEAMALLYDLQTGGYVGEISAKLLVKELFEKIDLVPKEPLNQIEIEFIQGHKIIEAIKSYRERTRVSLVVAKNVVCGYKTTLRSG